MENPPKSSTQRSYLDWLWYILALSLIIFVGALNLYFPFVADHVVPLTAAKTIAAGGTIYVDFWDNKMPGLFWFYFVAGELFGYTEFGVHMLDLIWMSIFSLILMFSLRDYLIYPWLSALATVAVVGVYYVSVELFLLTQLEALVWLPIYLSLLCGLSRVENPHRVKTLFFLSGIFAGVTVVFKLIFAPLFVVFWLILSWHLLRTKRFDLVTAVTNLWVPVSCGVVSVLGLVVYHFWSKDALGELLWTAFEYPPRALDQSQPAPYLRLFESTRFFVTYFSPWAGFALYVCWRWWKSKEGLMTSLLIAWAIVCIVVILVQRFSWWPYHFLLLYAPVGILSARGFAIFIQSLSESGGQRLRSPMKLSAFLAIPLLGAVMIAGKQKFSPYTAVMLEKPGTVEELQVALNFRYHVFRQNSRFLNDEAALPGKIYVFGNPLYYHLSGREPALPIIGWPWEYFLQSQWQQIPQQLDEARPPYIYIDEKNQHMMELRGAGVAEFIQSRYARLLKDEQGQWYILKPKYRLRAGI